VKSVGFRVYGLVGFRVYGLVGFRVSGFSVGFRVYGNLSARAVVSPWGMEGERASTPDPSGQLGERLERSSACTEAGSYLRLIDLCFTLESNKEEETTAASPRQSVGRG